MKYPLHKINPYDKNHPPGFEHTDAEHRQGIEVVKELIRQGKEIRPIAVNEKMERLDGFKRYFAFKELGYYFIPIELQKRPGCQYGKSFTEP